MAAEAAGKIVVAKVAGRYAPAYIHVWENVAEINLCDVGGTAMTRRA